MFRLILILAAVMAATTALIEFSSAEAQQRAVLRAQTVDTQTGFTDAFQEAMESGNYRQAASLVRSGDAMHRASSHRRHVPATASGSSSSATSLAANTPPTEPAEYTCNSGNCACAGASDCVAMAPICVEGTIGCNDYGCTCQEATD